MEIPFIELIHPEDRAMVAEIFRGRQKGDNLPTNYSFRALKKNGGPLWVEINAARTMWEGRPAMINFIRDIQKRKEAEEELYRKEKLASLGVLTH